MIRESFLEEEEPGQELEGCGGWEERSGAGTGGMEKALLISCSGEEGGGNERQRRPAQQVL